MLTYFVVVQGQIAEIGAPRKMLITSEWNKLERSALRRSKENNFLYLMIILKFQIQWEIFSQDRAQNVKQKLTSLVNCWPIKFLHTLIKNVTIFRMVKTAALYLLSLWNYSIYNRVH